MRKVIESELDEPLEETFAAFEHQPIAAASIGQVYRARLHDGRDVAVKVQYPGVAQAVRADMQNLGMILRLMKRIAPGLDVKATAEEIRGRIGDELDYELEAQNQRTMARIYRGHPFIVVPDVVSSLSREKVMVSEFVTGAGFDTIKEMDQEARDRVGEIIFRFFFGCMYRHRQFSGDPHPGNFLLQPDGRVAFLDFGLFKVMPEELIRIELECQRAGHEGDGERLKQIWTETGFLAAARPLPPGQAARPVPRRDLVVRARRGDPARAGDRHAGDDRDVRPALLALRADAPRDAAGRPPVRPPRRRCSRSPCSPSCGRGATSTAIAREWMYDDAPVTELGREEAAFWPRRVARRRRSSGFAALARSGSRPRSPWSCSSCSRRRAPCARRSRDVRDWVDALGPGWRRSCSSPSRRSLTPLMFPGPLLAGRQRAAVRDRARLPGDARVRRARRVLAFSISRCVAGDAVEQLAGPRLTAIEELRQPPRLRVGALRADRPGRAVLARQLRRRADADPARGVRAATALGTAPRAFAYTALGGSLGNLRSPEAAIAVAVLVVMGALGLLLVARDVREQAAPLAADALELAPALARADHEQRDLAELVALLDEGRHREADLLAVLVAHEGDLVLDGPLVQRNGR